MQTFSNIFIILIYYKQTLLFYLGDLEFKTVYINYMDEGIYSVDIFVIIYQIYILLHLPEWDLGKLTVYKIHLIKAILKIQ